MTGQDTPSRGPTIREARSTAQEFLENTLPEVRRVSVTKVARMDAEGAAWEAEAEVWQPNPTIQALHLDTQRPVLDQQHYLVRMDALLNVVAYELARLE